MRGLESAATILAIVAGFAVYVWWRRRAAARRAAQVTPRRRLTLAAKLTWVLIGIFAVMIVASLVNGGH